LVAPEPPFPPLIVPVAWLVSDPTVASCAFQTPTPPAPPLKPLPPFPPPILPLLVSVAIVPPRAFQTPAPPAPPKRPPFPPLIVAPVAFVSEPYARHIFVVNFLRTVARCSRCKKGPAPLEGQARGPSESSGCRGELWACCSRIGGALSGGWRVHNAEEIRA